MDRLANKFTLAHLKTYNMEGGVPVAPEGRDQDYALSGDKYSNFNAGKILLLLEGIGGEMAGRYNGVTRNTIFGGGAYCSNSTF